ncbi:MAG: hypothetical protein ACJ8F1_23470 [Polyangia bacterium]
MPAPASAASPAYASPAAEPSAPANAAAPVPGEGHRYQLVERPGVSFERAQQLASAMTFEGMQGHLVVLETSTYGEELVALFQSVHLQAQRGNKWYWIGASRPLSNKPAQEGWRWIDGSEVSTSLTSTWVIDMFEGPVPEGACATFRDTSPVLGDYAAVNPTGIVTGFLVEFEPPSPRP